MIGIEYKKMLVAKALILVLIISSTAFAQVSVAWIDRYNGPANGIDFAYAMVMDNNGNVYVTGGSPGSGTGVDYCTIKYDPNGTRLWTKRYDGPAHQNDSALAICVDNNNNIYVTGSSQDDYYTIKYNSDGVEQWSARYNGTGNDLDCARAIVVDAMQNAYITGVSRSGQGINYEDYATIKYNSSGTEQWVARYDRGLYDEATAIAVYGEGSVYVTGRSDAPADEPDYVTVKYLWNGIQDWVRIFDRYQQDIPRAIGIDEYGDVYVTGGSRASATMYDWATIKYTPDGLELWSRIRNWGDSDHGMGLAVHPDGAGYIYVTGDGNTDVATVKYNLDGEEQWYAMYNGTANSYDCGKAVDFDVFGNVHVTGYTYGTGTDYDYVSIKYDPDGNQKWAQVYGGLGGMSNDRARAIAVDDFGNTYVTGASGGDYATIKYVDCNGIAQSDDAQALAYNSNRHLVRKPNTTEELHLVFTHAQGIYYKFSSNGGTAWTYPLRIADGKWPAITLDADGLPAIVWTNDFGTLFYGKKNAGGQWWIYEIYSSLYTYLNSPPTIAITDAQPCDIVHIVYALTADIQTNGVMNFIFDSWFPIDDPYSATHDCIEYAESEAEARSYPSIVKDDWNTVHAVWMRQDTVCYAEKLAGQPWGIWGNKFGDYGLQAAHPFIEDYGDSVRVVWQHYDQPLLPEEIYRAARYRTNPDFELPAQQYTQTPGSRSLYAVNASGFFTVYVDEPAAPQYDIFYKNLPGNSPFNISTTSDKSMFCHSAARFTGSSRYLYTAWLEGDAAPYEIRYSRIQYSKIPKLAYLTSSNGHNPASPYLVFRDGYKQDWQVNVDYGYDTVSYRLPLKPGFRYQIMATAYHELDGEWREWICIDNQVQHLIKYNPFEPETCEIWVPEAFYQDGEINLTFRKDRGDFATAGPVYVYQYEYEGECEENQTGSGVMALGNSNVDKKHVVLTPNPFCNSLRIDLANWQPGTIRVKIFSADGRLVKELTAGKNDSNTSLNWQGDDNAGNPVAQGIYFIQVHDQQSNETYNQKVLRVK